MYWYVTFAKKILPSKANLGPISSEMLQLTFKNLPKSAGIEGGTLRGQKNFFWSKVTFLG